MQRSEGGALGMGGGGGGLISGRGAADMMVNITSWVGGLFFVTSLVLTVLAGGQPADRSVIGEDGRANSGFQLSVPFLNKGEEKTDASGVDLGAPSATIAAPVAPAPAEAALRAGPVDLSATSAAPTGALQAPGVSTTSPAVAAPIGAAGPAKVSGSSPIGSVTKASAPRPAVTPPKSGAAPMIPLSTKSPSTTTAPTAESAQTQSPAPPRDRSGPDE
jgi:preprotein translocase subunit SecG